VAVDVLIALGAAIAIGIPLWAIIDAARRPVGSFRRIGSNKTTWVVVLVVLTVFLNLAGIIASIVYLASVRPRLRRADAAPLDAGGRAEELPGPDTLASDEDREQETEQLRHHFETGRLTHEELDERLDAALRARTLGELSAVEKDLPQS